MFDDASIGRAKAMFAALDNSISRDAMQRLRSSPQGSVLGALNALFSPHPVTGAPSPQQAASQGLLGKMFAPAGGGNTPIAGGTSSTSTVRDVLTGQNAPQKVTVTQAGGATSGMSDQASRDLEAAAQEQKAAADDAKDAASDTKDAADKTSRAASDLSGSASGMKGVFDSLGKLFGGGGSGGGGSAAGSFAKGLGGGIGPGILGLNLKTTGIVAGVGSALAALPALAGVTGVGMGVAMIGGLVAEVAKGNAKLKAQFTTIGTDLKTVLATAAGPVIPAISAVLNQVPGLLKSIEPQLAGVFKVVAPQIQGVFNGLIPIVHGLVSIIQAAAPAFGPFIGAIEKLVGNLLPGIAMVIKATTPVLSQFGGILGTLGTHLGQVFSAAAPAIKASMTVLGALLDVLGGLLPVVIKLADVFAAALAPVITQLGGAIKALTPFFSVLGGLFASLAGAVLGDLVSAFTAVAQLLKAIAPSLTTFATALSSAFNVLENSGVFATLGDALENLVPLLATLVNQVLTTMTPLLPPIVTAFSELSQIMITALSQGLQQILPPLTQLAITVLQALATSLPVVLPVLGQVFAVFTTATADAIAGIVKALAGIVNAIPKPALDTLVTLAATLLLLKKTGVISLGIKIVGIAQKVLSWLTGAAKSATVDVAAAGMQKAGDTMVTAAAAMQRAADTMTGGGVKGGVPGVAGAGEETAAEDAGTAVGASLFATLAAPLFGALAGALLAGYLQKYTKEDHPAPATQQGPRGTNFNQGNSATAYKQYDQAVTQATSDLAALQKATEQVTADFTKQQQAAGQASQALSGYDSAVQKYGSGSSQAATAAEQLVADLENAGVNAGRAGDDVNAYTTAVTDNGLQSDQAQAARQRLVTDILNASNNAQQGRTDLANYTTAVQDNGARSQAAQSARARLITDLENSGLSAQQATKLVDGLSTAVKNLPSSKTITIHMDGSGLYTITGSAVSKSQGPTGSGNAAGGLAAGGPVTQGTGPTADDVPIMASKDEWVIKASSSNKYGPAAMNAVNQGTAVIGFASGGPVGGNLTPGYISGMYNSFEGQMTASMVSAMRASIKAAEAAASKTAAAAGGGSGAVANGSTITAALESLGITGTALADALKIISLESGGSLTATNPGSGAYGIAQFINGPSEYYQYGGNPNTVAGQITAFVAYVKQRYGTFQAALAFHLANGYYAAGGLVGALPRWFSGGQGGGFSGLQGLGGLQGMMSGASGGSANPLAGTSFVGNYTGVVSPASGGFGITAQQLGLPPPASSASSTSAGWRLVGREQQHEHEHQQRHLNEHQHRQAEASRPERRAESGHRRPGEPDGGTDREEPARRGEPGERIAELAGSNPVRPPAQRDLVPGLAADQGAQGQEQDSGHRCGAPALGLRRALLEPGHRHEGKRPAVRGHLETEGADQGEHLREQRHGGAAGQRPADSPGSVQLHVRAVADLAPGQPPGRLPQEEGHQGHRGYRDAPARARRPPFRPGRHGLGAGRGLRAELRPGLPVRRARPRDHHARGGNGRRRRGERAARAACRTPPADGGRCRHPPRNRRTRRGRARRRGAVGVIPAEVPAGRLLMDPMLTIAGQAGVPGRVIDLHAGVWRAEPDRQDSGRAEDRASCCPGCNSFDRWVYGMGGYASTRFAELCTEARQEAGPGRMWQYLDMAQAIDEKSVIDMTSGEEQTAAQRAEGVGMVRELVRRLDAAAEARQRRAAEIRLAQDQAAVDALLSRSAEIQLAADQLRADPRVARILDADLNGPDLSAAEVDRALRASMGLAARPRTPYEAEMPAVADLARAIGVRP